MLSMIRRHNSSTHAIDCDGKGPTPSSPGANEKKPSVKYAEMNVIFILHSLLALFVIGVPILSSDPHLLTLHIIIGVSLLVHWATNNHMCFLTYLEHVLFQTPIDETFMSRLIGGVYRISNECVYMCTIVLVLTSVLKWSTQLQTRTLSELLHGK